MIELMNMMLHNENLQTLLMISIYAYLSQKNLMTLYFDTQGSSMLVWT